jgi:hypothetical protein
MHQLLHRSVVVTALALASLLPCEGKAAPPSSLALDISTLRPPAKHCLADPETSNCTEAVVRLPSHGASATIIHTDERRTFLLSCGHAFEGSDRLRPIRVDGGAAPCGTALLMAIDYELDLSLLQVPSGRATAAAPVAGPGYRPSQHLLSVGYDEMRLPATQRQATILRSDPDVTWTREPPWHGRSGGALLDLDTGQLIGVVSGYVNPRTGPGLYVSHSAICRFLERRGWRSPGAALLDDHAEPRPEIAFPLPRSQPACPT